MRLKAFAAVLGAGVIGLATPLFAEPSWEDSCIYPLLHAWDERGPFVSCELDPDRALGRALYEGGYVMELSLGEPPVESLGVYGYPRVYSHNGELLYTLVPESVRIDGQNALRYKLIDPNGEVYAYRGVMDGQGLLLEVECPDGSIGRYEISSQEGGPEGADEGFACLAGSYSQALAPSAQTPVLPGPTPPSSVQQPGQASQPAPAQPPSQGQGQAQPVSPLLPPGAPPQAVPMPQPLPPALPGPEGGWYPIEPPSPGWEEWIFLVSRLRSNS